MPVYSFYLPDGTLLPGCIVMPEDQVAVNTPPGATPIMAALDSRCQRVQLVTDDDGTAVPVIVDWQPPKPAVTLFEDWVWSDGRRCWERVPTRLARERIARAERNRLLANTDWVVSRANELGASVPAVWISYRQALRDAPTDPAWPSPVWPTPPSE